jgi:hypothetical protein
MEEKIMPAASQIRLLYRWARAKACQAIALVALVFLITATQTWAAADQVPSGTGTPSALRGPKLSVGPARTVVLDEIPQATRAELAAHPAPMRPRDGLTDEQHRARKLEAEILGRRGAAVSSPSRGPSSSLKPPFPFAFASFAGTDQSAACGTCTPSDMALAVNENFVVQVINTAVTVFDKRGNVQPGFPKSINTFFGLSSTAFTTDPRVFYDWDSHRFLIVMLLESDLGFSDNVGSLLIAASQTHDPRGGWFLYSPAFQIGNTGECPDFPTLGHDTTNWGAGVTKGGFYVGINQFDTTCSSLIQNYLFLMPKDAVYSGGGFGPVVWSSFTDGPLVDTLSPANVTGRGDKTQALYFLNTFNINFGGGQCSSSCNGLIVWAIANPFGGGGFTAKVLSTVNSYSLPPLAHEPGCTGPGCIDTNDTRISGQVKYNAGSLFGSFETAAAGQAHPIWFEIRPKTDVNGNITDATELQEDCFFCGGFVQNGSAYFATLQPDPEGNVTMVYNYSEDDQFPGTAYTSRKVDYCCLMNGSGFFIRGGDASYGQGRWGDYTATAVDNTISTAPATWFSGMFAESTGNWGTWIGANQPFVP